MDILNDPRFAGIEKFDRKIWLSSPTMHGEEQKWVDDAIKTNWVSTVGANINEVEKQMAEYVGCRYAVGLSCGTASLHLAIKLAGEALYGQALRSLTDKYEVKEIVGNQMKIKLAKSQTDKGEALKAAYAAVMGNDR